MRSLFTGTTPSSLGSAWTCLLLLAITTGCDMGDQPAPVVDPARPVKTLILSARDAGIGVELPAEVRTVPPIDLSFNGVSGRIVELPISGREGQGVLKGELLAQIDPEPFRTALSDAEGTLGDAYSVLGLARSENERMEKMKEINPDLVSETMLERTRDKLLQAEARLESTEAKVKKAEDLLENTSLRAPVAGIVTRCLAENHQSVQAGDPILGFQDTTRLEVLVEVPDSMTIAMRELSSGGATAIARFPSIPGEDFPLTIKERVLTGDSDARTHPLVLEMSKPTEIDLPSGTTGKVYITGKEAGTPLGPILVPAIAVMTDPDGKDYVWLVDGEELRAHRRDVRIGRLTGPDQIQILSGLAGGERIVVAGVMQLAEGRRVRLWKDRGAPNGP